METLIFHILMPLAVCFGLSSLCLMAGTYAEHYKTVKECRNFGVGFMIFGIIVSLSNWLQWVFKGALW